MEDKIRHFGGKLFVPKDGKVRTPANIMERNFEKKHLKAYLRGDKKFSFGRDAHGDTAWYFVNEIWL